MIPADGRERYVKAYSHRALAKEWEVSIASLQEYAQDNGWDREHKLHWADVAMEALKMKAEEQEVSAIKELLRATGISRPVGRPSKLEVQKHIAIEARIAEEYEKDIERLRGIPSLSIVRDN